MLIANAWLTFMTTPAGVSESGAVISTWAAVHNYTWMPINIHRVIANVAFGGSVAAAYAAFKFLGAKTDEERAHYDWMGYIGNFVAICAFLPLPFAGYWLASEIYAYSQTLGLTMMGGAFSWLFIIQAVLIGNLFLGANYYLWLGMGRVQASERFQGYIKYLLILIALCFAVWATPRSIIATVSETRAMGGGAAPAARLPGRHVRQEHRGQHPDPDHLRELPALPALGPHADRRPGRSSATRCRSRSRSLAGGDRALPRHLRLLRRGRGAHRALGPAGAARCCSR